MFDKYKHIIFKIIKSLFVICRRKICRIDTITKDDKSNNYIITFMYTTKRQIFQKSVTDIYQNKYLLREFSAHEAALIGFYSALYNHEKTKLMLEPYSKL